MTAEDREYQNFLNNFRNEVENDDSDNGWKDETLHAYEGAIVDYLKKIKDENIDTIDKNFKKIIEGVNLNPENNTDDEKVCYAAYCTLHTYYRRMREQKKLGALDRDYSEKFKNHQSFKHFKLLLYVDSSPLKVDKVRLMEAEESAQSMLLHTGAWHLLADLVARYYEEWEDLDSEFIEKDEWYKKGIDAVNCAIGDENTYAKFYSTRGRLYCLVNKYDEALQDIKEAIDREDSSNADYAMRISRYLVLQMKFEAQKQMYSLNKHREENEKELQDKFQSGIESAVLLNNLVKKCLEVLKFQEA